VIKEPPAPNPRKHLILTFSQTTGTLTDNEGQIVATGWSGHGEGKNNPLMQSVHNVGPLPQGLYKVGVWEDHPHLGHMVAHLSMVDGKDFGRDGFFIHGPSKDKDKYGEESQGCIVVPRPDRQKVHDLNPQCVQVVR
jgi:hypothetical protein